MATSFFAHSPASMSIRAAASGSSLVPPRRPSTPGFGELERLRYSPLRDHADLIWAQADLRPLAPCRMKLDTSIYRIFGEVEVAG